MRVFKKFINVLAVLMVAAAPILVIANAQEIEDWWKLRDYSAPAAVAKLADEDTMTTKARNLFYVNHPELMSDKATLRQFCTRNEQTIVLGCYHGNDNGIAIFVVSDPKLDGVEEVTAAHEMLHAAYERLGQSEKDRVNGMLEDYYKNGLTDSRVKDVMAQYQKTEPNDVVNEMHSVFGTEVSNLPPALEDYYKQYFADRKTVFNFSDQYESVFTQNENQLKSMKNQIDNLKAQLKSDKAEIDSEQDSLAAESKRMDSLRDSNRTQDYNAAVGPYDARVASLKSLISSYNANVDKVNSLVEQYNSLAYAQENLYESLDTRVQTQAAQ